MSNDTVKQAIAITSKGQVMQVGLPKSADDEYSFIKNYIGATPEPWEVYLTELPEVVWSMPASPAYYEQPVNTIATMIIRAVYQNEVPLVHGNVLITGIGSSNGSVDGIAPENIKFILKYANSLKEFFETISAERAALWLDKKEK
jgi:hypothetical protein